MTKILDLVGPVLIIALLALLTSERYYREPFYIPYIAINFLVFLVVWVGATLLLKIPFVYPRPKGFIWKIITAWSITSIISWIINHFISSGFLANLAAVPSYLSRCCFSPGFMG